MKSRRYFVVVPYTADCCSGPHAISRWVQAKSEDRALAAVSAQMDRAGKYCNDEDEGGILKWPMQADAAMNAALKVLEALRDAELLPLEGDDDDDNDHPLTTAARRAIKKLTAALGRKS